MTQSNKINKDTLFQSCYTVLDSKEVIQVVGRQKHQKEFTKSIIDYFFIIRMHFIAKQFNTENRVLSNESRKYRKMAKMQ